MNLHKLFSLPHLHAKRTNGKETLVDYLELHVVMFDEYFDFFKNKSWTRKEHKK
jgi:hypothetical protein